MFNGGLKAAETADGIGSNIRDTTRFIDNASVHKGPNLLMQFDEAVCGCLQ
jgi:hypothetical protein